MELFREKGKNVFTIKYMTSGKLMAIKNALTAQKERNELDKAGQDVLSILKENEVLIFLSIPPVKNEKNKIPERKVKSIENFLIEKHGFSGVPVPRSFDYELDNELKSCFKIPYQEGFVYVQQFLKFFRYTQKIV